MHYTGRGFKTILLCLGKCKERKTSLQVPKLALKSFCLRLAKALLVGIAKALGKCSLGSCSLLLA